MIWPLAYFLSQLITYNWVAVNYKHNLMGLPVSFSDTDLQRRDDINHVSSGTL